MIQILHKKELESFLDEDELEMFSRLKELIQRLNKTTNHKPHQTFRGR